MFPVTFFFENFESYVCLYSVNSFVVKGMFEKAPPQKLAQDFCHTHPPETVTSL